MDVNNEITWNVALLQGKKWLGFHFEKNHGGCSHNLWGWKLFGKLFKFIYNVGMSPLICMVFCKFSSQSFQDDVSLYPIIYVKLNHDWDLGLMIGIWVWWLGLSVDLDSNLYVSFSLDLKIFFSFSSLWLLPFQPSFLLFLFFDLSQNLK